jgi:hypothetical protein
MNTPNVRFGNIGIIYGSKPQGEKLLDVIGRHEGGIYYAENWAPAAGTDKAPKFVYVTGKHLADLKGDKPSFDTLSGLYHYEFKGASDLPGTSDAISDCRSGKGVARVHNAFNLQA